MVFQWFPYGFPMVFTHVHQTQTQQRTGTCHLLSETLATMAKPRLGAEAATRTVLTARWQGGKVLQWF